MIADRIEGKWIDLFAEVFARCKVAAEEPCAVLSESQSRALNVQLAEWRACKSSGARPFHVVVPTPRQSAPGRRSHGSNAPWSTGACASALAASWTLSARDWDSDRTAQGSSAATLQRQRPRRTVDPLALDPVRRFMAAL